MPTRRITFLDGDVVRTHLSKGLGFSISDRNDNVARIGWVAAELVRQGGVVLASAIAPFTASRTSFRDTVAATGGGMFTIFVSSSLKVCAARDVKGLYELAASGRTDLTGVSHPYELPDSGVDLLLDTDKLSVDDSVAAIVTMLLNAGYLDAASLVQHLTPIESALLPGVSAANGHASTVPGFPLALPRVFTAGRHDVSFDAGAMCTLDYDSMELTTAASDKQVRLYGGLPMRASIAHGAVAIRRKKTGSVSRPPANLLWGAAPGVLGLILRDQLATALTGEHVAGSFLLPAARIHAAEALSASATVDEAAALKRLSEEDFAPASHIATEDARLSDLDTQWESASPAANKLKDAQRVYVAYDLWTQARWHHHSLQASTTATSFRPLSLFTSPRLISYLPYLLRLDVCARAVIVLPRTASPQVIDLMLPDGEGARDVKKAQAYFDEMSTAADAIVAAFPLRVKFLRASDTLVAWASKHETVSSGRMPQPPAELSDFQAMIEELVRS
ncbi:adenylyl-sulfate kinase [archaeon]|nr:MAG: adenylyl-sulfate kinase [archaeon]